MTLKEQVYSLYKKVYNTNEEPDIVGLAKMFNVFAQAIECCSDAEEQLGTDVYNLVKKYTKVNKRSVMVDITKIMDELNKS